MWYDVGLSGRHFHETLCSYDRYGMLPYSQRFRQVLFPVWVGQQRYLQGQELLPPEAKQGHLSCPQSLQAKGVQNQWHWLLPQFKQQLLHCVNVQVSEGIKSCL